MADENFEGPPQEPDDFERALLALYWQPDCVSARDWVKSADDKINEAGLYTWWVDQAGAEVLSAGLELTQPLAAGMVYLGQTGATKWPSGKKSRNTLRRRIGRSHLRGPVSVSTLRKTLAAILRDPLGLSVGGPGKLEKNSEDILSAWIANHLSVALFVFPDRDVLGALEVKVLRAIDPPLNVEHMNQSYCRSQLSTLRDRLKRGL